MELHLSIPLTVKERFAAFQFPEALRREMFKSAIKLNSLYLPKNLKAKNEPLIVVCNNSCYRNRSQELQKNILGLFLNKSRENLFEFIDDPVPITQPQKMLENKITYLEGDCQKVSAVGVIHISGSLDSKFSVI